MPPPPPPPPQRCCCSKNTLALKGAALAGVAIPMRTDHAITANTVVFMAVSPRTKDIVSTPPKRGLGTGNADRNRDRRRGARCAFDNQRALALDMRISASLPIFSQTLHLRNCFADAGLGKLDECESIRVVRRSCLGDPPTDQIEAWDTASHKDEIEGHADILHGAPPFPPAVRVLPGTPGGRLSASTSQVSHCRR